MQQSERSALEQLVSDLKSWPSEYNIRDIVLRLESIINRIIQQKEPKFYSRSFPVEDSECDGEESSCEHCRYQGTRCDTLLMPHDNIFEGSKVNRLDWEEDVKQPCCLPTCQCSLCVNKI